MCVDGVCPDGFCDPGYSYCEGGCRNTRTDPSHCGACGRSCHGSGCVDGVCEGGSGERYAFRDWDFPTITIPTDDVGPCTGDSHSGELSAGNVPLTSVDGARVTEMSVQYVFEPGPGVPTVTTAYRWEGSGTVPGVGVVAAVRQPGGEQYVADASGRRVYVQQRVPELPPPGTGFGPEQQIGAAWAGIFVTHDGDRFVADVSEEEARRLFAHCFELADLQVLELGADPPFVD
jgi:hypothetical protein